MVIFRLPRSHYHCTWENFEWPDVRPRGLRAALEAFRARMTAGEAPHVLLTGPPGIGKTHLGVALYRLAALEFGTMAATWLNVPAFCETVKRAYGESGADPWEDVEAATRLVVLDDLFGRELTSHEKDQILTRLLDVAYTNGAAVVATMNPSVSELAARLPAHEISRLLAAATVIPLAAPTDRRR